MFLCVLSTIVILLLPRIKLHVLVALRRFVKHSEHNYKRVAYKKKRPGTSAITLFQRTRIVRAGFCYIQTNI